MYTLLMSICIPINAYIVTNTFLSYRCNFVCNFYVFGVLIVMLTLIERIALYTRLRVYVNVIILYRKRMDKIHYY